MIEFLGLWLVVLCIGVALASVVLLWPVLRIVLPVLALFWLLDTMI